MTSLLEKNLTLRVKNDKRFASTWKAIRGRSSTPRLGAPPSRGRGRGSCARAERRGRAAPRGYRRRAGRGARRRRPWRERVPWRPGELSGGPRQEGNRGERGPPNRASGRRMRTAPRRRGVAAAPARARTGGAGPKGRRAGEGRPCPRPVLRIPPRGQPFRSCSLVPRVCGRRRAQAYAGGHPSRPARACDAIGRRREVPPAPVHVASSAWGCGAASSPRRLVPVPAPPPPVAAAEAVSFLQPPPPEKSIGTEMTGLWPVAQS